MNAANAGSALLTDLYQLTMAYGYWRAGIAERVAAFHLFFRRNPFDGGYAVACGTAAALEYLASLRFAHDELDYLAALRGADGRPLFDERFIAHLAGLRFTCDVDVVPEGTVVFAREPLVRVLGPVLQAQLVETALLTLVNFPTLVATKAARVCEAAGGDPVLEFGLRRAQGPDGGLSASRAAYVGGCAATSNLLAGMRFGIPVRGTHAHSWVLLFDDEPAAFQAYADALPNNVVFLVDTYDTLDGVRHAIGAGQRLRERGYPLAGIRLDSGDLAWLSRQARRLLDEAGFHDTAILASNDLDEELIASLKREQGAAIGVWGVGTKLVTAWDQPALGGVYKLTAARGADGRWEPRIKLSEQAVKVNDPGILQVRRYSRDGRFVADAIVDELAPPPDGPITIVDPADPTRRRRLGPECAHEPLLVPGMRGGCRVHEPPPLAATRDRARDQLARLDPAVRRFRNPHGYPVGLEEHLHDRKQRLVLERRGFGDPAV